MPDKRGFTLADTGFLLGVKSDAVAWGITTWMEQNGSLRATWPVTAGAYAEGDLLLQMLVRPRRPSEPTVLYLVGGEPMRRVDMNGGHQGKRFSHEQGAAASGRPVQTNPVPADFVDVQFAPTVPDGTYHRVFQDAAKLFHVDIAAVDWEDPPEGAAS